MGVTISGFYDEASGKLDEQIALVKELGESFICPRNIDGKNIADFTLEEFKTAVYPRLSAAEVRFSSIGSPIGKIDIDDDEAYEKQKKQLAELVGIASLMGCKYIRIFSFYYGKQDPDACVDKAIEKLRGFLKIAEGSGVSLMHENEKKIVGDVPSRVIKLHDALKDEGLELCFDASNYIQCGVDPKQAFDSLADRVSYYHIKDCSEYGVEVPVGVGKGRYPYIIGELVKRGYDGFLTLEPHTFKYSMMKLPVYLFPFAPFFMKNYFKAFRLIDKAMGVKALKGASRKQVFVWQYENLKKLLKEGGAK